MKQETRFCGRCGKHTIWKKQESGILLNVILVIFTLGLWVIPWVTNFLDEDVAVCSECYKQSFWDGVILVVVFVVIISSFFVSF